MSRQSRERETVISRPAYEDVRIHFGFPQDEVVYGVSYFHFEDENFESSFLREVEEMFARRRRYLAHPS